MKPESPIDERVSADDNALVSTPSVVVSNNQQDNNDNGDYDMDDEVMGFMHSNIHRQLMKFTKKSAWGIGRKRQMMDADTKAYFQEVIRGSGLFGILTREASVDSNSGAKGLENFMDDGWADLEDDNQSTTMNDNSKTGKSDDDNTDKGDNPEATEAAEEGGGLSQFTRLLLAKKVAEAFRTTKRECQSGDEEVEATAN